MATPTRAVPLTYKELSVAIGAGAYPSERTWIDFKRRLYPEGDNAADQAARNKVSQELARDMASMSEFGGFLIYGVREDKTNHLFIVDDMQLPVGLHETVDAVARDRITPPLSVVPTLVPNPDTNTTGLLVVEIPESPNSPHMTDYTYWGRSETGKVRLSDEQVERLMLSRNRLEDRLAEEMRGTVADDPVDSGDRRNGHFYFTAVPARGWPDMFSKYSSDRQSRVRLMQRCTDLINELRGEQQQRPTTFAFSAMNAERRTLHTGWISTLPVRPDESRGRTVGVDDDGPIRYINIGATGPLGIHPDTLLVHEVELLFETRDMVQLVGALADDVHYRGSWLIGVHADGIAGHLSQLADPYVGGMLAGTNSFSAPSYTRSTRASALEVCDNPEAVTARLLRVLLRSLGSEVLLSSPPFA